MPYTADSEIDPEVAAALRNGSARVAHRWLTKAEAQAMLGVSERTIETWIGEQRLGSRPEPRPGKRPLTMVDGDDVERIRAERNKGAIIRTPPASTEIAPVSPAAPNELLALALRMMARDAESRTAIRPWLNLEEAAEYSGLPKSFLLALAVHGTLLALNVGTERQKRWRFNRAALARIDARDALEARAFGADSANQSAVRGKAAE
jgi:hypothetical protein